MEVISRIISETKVMAMKEEDLKKELRQLKSTLLMEEQNLASLSLNKENLRLESNNLQQNFNQLVSKTDLIKSFRELFKNSALLLSFMRKFIEKADPTKDQQLGKLSELNNNYVKMLKKYEEHPTYLQILLEEAAEKEMSNKITEKRNQLMKLETERDF